MRERLEQLLYQICKIQRVTVGKTASLLEIINLPAVKEYIGSEQLHKGLNFARIVAAKFDNPKAFCLTSYLSL